MTSTLPKQPCQLQLSAFKTYEPLGSVTRRSLPKWDAINPPFPECCPGPCNSLYAVIGTKEDGRRRRQLHTALLGTLPSPTGGNPRGHWFKGGRAAAGACFKLHNILVAALHNFHKSYTLHKASAECHTEEEATPVRQELLSVDRGRLEKGGVLR